MKRDTIRQVQKVIGGFEMWDGRRAREVVVKYGLGPSRREIEVEVNGEYAPRYTEIGDRKRGARARIRGSAARFEPVKFWSESI